MKLYWQCVIIHVGIIYFILITFSRKLSRCIARCITLHSVTGRYKWTNPSLFAGVKLKDTREKLIIYLSPHPPPKKTKFLNLLVSVSFQKQGDLKFFFFPLQLPEYHVVWLEDLFELSSNFDAPNPWRVRMMHYSCVDPASLQNREVWPREKRGMSV